MKHEIGIVQPEYLIEDWPGKYEVFSWLEYVVIVPNPIFLITTRKANGAPNANLHSWSLLTGERGNYSSVLALLDHTHTHTHANILREGEWCVYFPSFEHYPQCFETIYCSGSENDEIIEAGFTVEPAKTVRSPRISERMVSLECRLEWHRPLYEDSQWHLSVGRVLYVAMDESAMEIDPAERMQALGLMYNVRGTVNPLDGRQYGPNALGLLGEVVKIFTDEGHPKGWRVKA
jgi:flavin reductase (DIM6/NTAB) family NADH-FMN oxidoreductase RutF